MYGRARNSSNLTHKNAFQIGWIYFTYRSGKGLIEKSWKGEVRNNNNNNNLKKKELGC